MTTQTTMPNHTIHQGRNVKRFREMLGIKQDAMAFELGEDWTQKKISLLEAKEIIDTPLLEQISAILKVPVEAIQNFDEEQAVNVIANTYSFQDFKDNAVAAGFNYQPSFNPVDKMVELYERMLISEREKVELLKEILEKIK